MNLPSDPTSVGLETFILVGILVLGVLSAKAIRGRRKTPKTVAVNVPTGLKPQNGTEEPKKALVVPEAVEEQSSELAKVLRAAVIKKIGDEIRAERFEVELTNFADFFNRGTEPKLRITFPEAGPIAEKTRESQIKVVEK